VLSVVIFHAFPKWCKGGFVGVDIFFVISGFLISGIIIEQARPNAFTYADFYSRRVRRIFPALVIMVGAVLVFGAVTLLADEYTKAAQHAFFGLVFAANLDLFSATGYFDGDAKMNPFLHLWSLGVEEQYYIVWPPAVILAIRTMRSPKYLLLVCAAASFALNVALVYGHRDAAFYLPVTRFWELLAGAWLAYRAIYADDRHDRLARVFDSTAFRNAASVIGIALIVFSIVVIDENKAFPGFWAVLPVGGAFLVILAGPNAILNRWLLSSPLAVFVGLISYPLYIWHWPLLVLNQILSLGYPSPVSRGVAVGLALLLAWVTYRWVELPVRASRRTGTVLALLAIAAGLTAASAAIRLDRGLPFRPVDVAARHSAEPGPALAVQQFFLKLKSFPACDAGVFPVNAPGAGWCLTAHPGPARYVLLGDSHAQALFPGLAQAEPGNLMLLGGKGCPPVQGVRAWYLGTSETCRGQMDLAYATAARQSSVTTVVLTMAVPFYITDTGLAPDHLGNRSPGNYRLQGPGADGRNKTAVIEAGLRRSIARLLGAGKRVEILLDTPEMAWNPQQCVARRWTLHAPFDCAMPRSAVMARQADYRAMITRIVADMPAVQVFDPLPVVCNATTCPMIRDDQLIYRDSHHLSLAGSAMVGAAFVRWQQAIEAQTRHP